MAVLEENIYITSNGEEWLESELVSEAEANDVTLEALIGANDLTLKEEVEDVETEELYINSEGEEWSVDELTSAAEDNNVSFDDLLAANDLKLKGGEKEEEEEEEDQTYQDAALKGREEIETLYKQGLKKIEQTNISQEEKDIALKKWNETREFNLNKIKKAEEKAGVKIAERKDERKTRELVDDGSGVNDWLFSSDAIRDSQGEVLIEDDDAVDSLFKGDIVELIPVLRLQYADYEFGIGGGGIFEEVSGLPSLGLMGSNSLQVKAPNGETLDLFSASTKPTTKREVEEIKRKLGMFVSKHGIDVRKQAEQDEKIFKLGEEIYATQESQGGLKINDEDLKAINKKYSVDNLFVNGELAADYKESELMDPRSSLNIDFYKKYQKMLPNIIMDRNRELLKQYKQAGSDKSEKEIMAEATTQVLNYYRDEAIKEKEASILNQYLKGNDLTKKAVLNVYRTKKHNKDFEELAVAQSQLQLRLDNISKNPNKQIYDNFVKIYDDPNGKFEYSEGDTLLKLENGKIINEETWDKFLEAETNIKLEYNSIQKDQNEILKKIDTTKIDEAGKVDLLRREYDMMSKSLTTIGLGFADIGMGLGYLGIKMNELTGLGETEVAPGVTMNDISKQQILDYNNWKRETKEGYMKDVSFEDAFDSVSNFGQFMAQEVSTQIPIMATIVATGGAAMPLIASWSAGQHWMEMDIEDWTDNKPGSRSEWEKGLKSVGYGLAEAVFEGLTTIPILKRTKGLLTSGGAGQLLDLKSSMKRYWKENAIKGLVYDPALESFGEAGTQITQNLIDGRPAFEGVDHAMFSGFMIGQGMGTTGFFGGMAMRNFTDHKTYENFRNNVKQIDELRNYSASPNIHAETKTIIDEKIKTLEAENSKQLEILEGRLSNKIGTKAYNTFAELTNTQERLRTKAEAIFNDKQLDATTKENLLGQLKEEFDNTQRARDIMRDPEMFGNEMNALKFSEKLEDVNKWSEIEQIAIEKIKASKNKGPAYKPTNTEIDAAAYDVFLDRKIDENIEKANRSTAKNTKVEGLQSKSDAINYMEDIKEGLLADGMSETDYFGVIQGIKDGTANGFNWKGSSGKNFNIVFKDNAIANERMDVSTHEPGHAVMADILGSNEGNFDGVAEQIKVYLEKTNPKLLARMQARGDARRGSEEFVMEFMEEVARDTKGERIKLQKPENKKFVNLLGFMMNSTIKEAGKDFDIDFRSETEVVNFIIGLGKSISQGTLTEADVAAAKESDVIKKIKEDTKATTKKKPKESKTKQSKTELKEVFDKITGSAENLKFESKEQFKKSPEFFDGLLQIEQTNTLDGSIGNTVSSAYLDMNPKFIEDVKKRISDKYQSEYDASKNSLFGWLLGKNPIVNFAAGDIQNINKKKPKTTPIERKVGGEDSKVTVGERLVSKEISPEDATDVALMRDRLKKIKPQTSKIAKKLGLTTAQENLVKRDIINYLRSPKRPSMDNPKKFFKGFVDHMSATTGARLYDIMPNKKGMKAFLETFADDLIALNKVDPAVMRRANWDIFYEMEIDNMNPTQTQKAIDEGRIPESTSLTAGNTLWKTLNPTPAQVTDYLMNIRQDQLKRKLPKFFAEVLGKNEFSDIVDNPVQPVYTPEGKIKKGETIDLKENITTEEAKVGKPKVKDIIARPGGVKFSNTIEQTILDSGVKFSTTEQVSYEDHISDSKHWTKLEKELGGKHYDFNNPTDLKDWKKNELPKLVKIFPKDFLMNSGAFYGNKGFPFKAKDGEHRKAFEEYLDTNFGGKKQVKYGPKIEGLDIAITKKGSPGTKKTGAGKTGLSDKFNNYFGGEKHIADNAIKVKVLKEIFKRIQNAEGNIISAAVGMLKTTSREQTHFMRKISPITFRELGMENLTPWEIRDEHALGASLTAKQALFLAHNKVVDDNFTGIQLNYFQGPLSKTNDDKVNVKELGMKEGPQKQDLYNVLMGVESGWLRYAMANLDLNNIQIIDSKGDKILLTEFYGVAVPKGTKITPEIIAVQDSLIIGQIKGKITKYRAGRSMRLELPLTKRKFEAAKKNNAILKESKIYKPSESSTNAETIRELGILDKALQIARDPNAPVKKIRVFDFDDTLARTKSNVLYTMPDGKTGKITPAEFAKRGTEMEAEGAVWDFSEFNKVVDGKRGPLLEVAKKIQAARGTEDVFVLTARTQEAAGPIKQFLESVGLNIPINNITGLGDSSPLAKSGWIVNKAAEGYNDFYFADDHGANVEAVQEALDALPVKGKTQQAKVKFSMDTKRDLKWRKHDFRFISNFEIEGKTYTIDLAKSVLEGSKDYVLSFGLNRQDKKGFSKKDHFITGTGNAAEILSIISNGVVDFVKKNKVDSIHFNSFEGSRTRLYTTLTKLWANKLDWKHEIEYDPEYKDMKGAASFVISKTKSSPTQKVLDVVDVKGKVQQAKVKFSQTVDEKFNEIIEDKVKSKVKFSKNIDEEFNEFIENKTGIDSFKEFSSAQAKLRGKNKGRFKFFVPPSADDFVGLLYHLLGKGKKGDAQMAWFKEHLLDPYARAMADITRDRVQMMADFKALKKNLKNIPKNLRKEAFDGYTYENVARIYAWNKQGSNIPGLSKADLAKVEAFVAKNPEIQVFADQLIDITKGSGYSIPTDSWLSGTITTDLVSVLNNNKRKVYLEQWKNNVDLIFSDKNLNKLEAALGSNFREALENMLTRMESGNNKSTRGSDRLANRFLDYVNNSVGTVMFFNMRSAVLQLISSVNFINWGDNNIIAAGKAFANQKQYWKDFMTLMNSEFLVDRRNGLQINVSESEIADAAATSKNKAKGVIAYILKKGFLPTQFADSFAIASGGATFYRNKVNRYIKEGMSQKEAEAKAFNDFREIAEESQQSSRPDRISQQQASGLGRIILAFANTPMQYTRLIKKATLDLANGRGDWKSNVSKIVYYAAVQNIIFNALQQAIFAIAWGEDDEETDKAKKEKMYSVANGMLDSILRGTGIAGGVLSVVKNIAMEIYDRSGRKRPEYAMVALRLLDISPPIDVKVSKLRQAANNYEYNKDLIKSKGFAIDNPAWLSMGYVLSSTLNIPLDRLILKMNNVKFALDSDEETWKRIAAALGYPEWQLRSAGELEDYKQLRKQEKKDHKNLQKWEVIDGDEIESLKKDQQVNILTEIGLSKEEIKDLKYEEDRVNRILEEYEKDEKKVTKILEKNRTATAPIVEEEKEEEKKVEKKTERKKILKDDRTTAQTRLYKLRKADQVDTLASLGLSDAQIKALKYEEDRVREIERLYEEKNN